jgi:hypothetical protein
MELQDQKPSSEALLRSPFLLKLRSRILLSEEMVSGPG